MRCRRGSHAAAPTRCTFKPAARPPAGLLPPHLGRRAAQLHARQRRGCGVRRGPRASAAGGRPHPALGPAGAAGGGAVGHGELGRSHMRRCAAACTPPGMLCLQVGRSSRSSAQLAGLHQSSAHPRRCLPACLPRAAGVHRRHLAGAARRAGAGGVPPAGPAQRGGARHRRRCVRPGAPAGCGCCSMLCCKPEGQALG